MQDARKLILKAQWKVTGCPVGQHVLHEVGIGQDFQIAIELKWGEINGGAKGNGGIELIGLFYKELQSGLNGSNGLPLCHNDGISFFWGLVV